jgi:hypothetical protein
MGSRSQRRARQRRRIAKKWGLIGGNDTVTPELTDPVPSESEKGAHQNAMLRRLPGSFESGKRQ